jgi:hypothetical protein
MDRFSTLLTVAKDLFLEKQKATPLIPSGGKGDSWKEYEFLADKFMDFFKRLYSTANSIKD